MSKKGLGKGLAALIPEDIDLASAIAPKQTTEKETVPAGKPLLLPLSHISPNPNQPRKDFDPKALQELAASIKNYGVLQPIVVTKAQTGEERGKAAEDIYFIIAGERRWRAAALAGLTEIPAFVKDQGDQPILELALIENIQREDLNGFEEAVSFQQLIDEFGYTQEQLAQKMGKSRPYVANALRLLSLRPAYQKLVREGILTPGHARAVLSLNNEKQQQQLVDMVVKDRISVRQAEQWAKLQKEKNKLEKKQQEIQKKEKNNQPYVAVRKKLEEKYGTKIQIEQKEKGGQIRIQYFDIEDLTRLVDLLLPGETF